jgi:hypothetical protein
VRECVLDLMVIWDDAAAMTAAARARAAPDGSGVRGDDRSSCRLPPLGVQPAAAAPAAPPGSHRELGVHLEPRRAAVRATQGALLQRRRVRGTALAVELSLHPLASRAKISPECLSQSRQPIEKQGKRSAVNVLWLTMHRFG